MSGNGDRCFQRDGQIYVGEVVEKEEGVVSREGEGLLLYRAVTVDGMPMQWGRYKGAWKDDDMCGKGRYDWNDGSCYEGDFRNGRPHGPGKLMYPEGSYYDGAWQDGVMTGQGTFFDAFTGIKRHGEFRKNRFRQDNGSWLDLAKERDSHRKEKLYIGARGPNPESSMPVIRCTVAELPASLEELKRKPPFLVPLILGDASLPSTSKIIRGPDWDGAPSKAPLWCLEDAAGGCTTKTTVHMAYAAAEKRRKWDVPRIFREAIKEALLTYRYFALVFGEGYEPPTTSHGQEKRSESIPTEWGLPNFLEPASLPPDLFDLRNFHRSGAVDNFLPPQVNAKGGLGRRLSDARSEAGGTEEAAAEGQDEANEAGRTEEAAAEGQDEANEAGRDDGQLAKTGAALPVAYLLQFAMVSLHRLEEGWDDAQVRRHLGTRFGAHVPLHRVAAVVVRSD